MKICSLLPSATEIVFLLGLEDQLVGVTHECDFPPRARSLPAVTRSNLDHSGHSSSQIHRHVSKAVHEGSSIYSLDRALLEQLRPDLILTQELCRVCAVSYGQIRKAVRQLDGNRNILSLEPTSVAEILQCIERVGEVTGTAERARREVAALQDRIERVTDTVRRSARIPRVLTLEWLDPPFVGGHWVPEMVRLAGGLDLLGKEREPSRQVGWKEIQEAPASTLILMPCGYDLPRTLEALREIEAGSGTKASLPSPEGGVFAVNGSAFFNRPGPRIVDGIEILAEILHPESVPPSREGRDWIRVESPASQGR